MGLTALTPKEKKNKQTQNSISGSLSPSKGSHNTRSHFFLINLKEEHGVGAAQAVPKPFQNQNTTAMSP